MSGSRKRYLFEICDFLDPERGGVGVPREGGVSGYPERGGCRGAPRGAVSGSLKKFWHRYQGRSDAVGGTSKRLQRNFFGVPREGGVSGYPERGVSGSRIYEENRKFSKFRKTPKSGRKWSKV